MPTHNITQSWSRSGEAVSVTVVATGSGEVNVDETIPASQTNMLITLAVDVSALKSLYISSDETLTIKTNSSGSPTDTLTITGGKPLVWYTGCGFSCPLTGDVTVIYVTNSAAAALKIRTLQDATP